MAYSWGAPASPHRRPVHGEPQLHIHTLREIAAALIHRARRHPAMVEHVFTPEQIEHGIASAVADREFYVVPGLLKLLAVQDPHRAAELLESMKDALAGRVTLTIDLGAHHA